jgi:hypothetical protein
VILMLGGCSTAAGSGAPVGAPTPSIVIPRTPAATKPATDCSSSTQALPTESETDGVQLAVSTDPSRTSMLLKNTGSMTVVVLPDEEFSTRLVAATSANPKDAPSRTALSALTAGGSVAGVTEIPPYVPLTQVITVPPRWAVCALTDNVEEAASVRYVQDRPSSAAYFVAKELADQLLLKTSAARAGQTLATCARDTLDAIKASPDGSDIELYVGVIGAGSRCRNGYKALLHGDERATGRLGSTVVNRLGSVPRLVPNSPLLSITAAP